MAENNQVFTLVGRFQDGITPKLKKLSAEFDSLSKNLDKSFAKSFKNIDRNLSYFEKRFDKNIRGGMSKTFKSLNAELRDFSKTSGRLGKVFGRGSDRAVSNLRDGIKGATEDAKVLGTTLNNVSKAGLNIDRSGLKAAQEDAHILGTILKANALIKVGEGFGNALTAGAQGATSILGKGAGFVAKQFKSAVEDELQDMQARGSLYGSLKKQGVFKGGTPEEDTRDYRQTKRISRINEEVIGDIVRESPVSTATISTLNRQLTDNLLPSLLKSRGVTDLGTQNDAQLEKTFGGKTGVGTELAKLYEQMATVMPSPAYARMGAQGFTQAITSGTINKQLAIFENNPVLVEALKTIDGGIASTADIGKRITILKKALEVASPSMMLDEMRLSVAGGMQAIQDTLTNPSVGIFSMAAEVAGQGEKSLKDFGKVNGAVIKGSAYEMKLLAFRRKQDERLGVEAKRTAEQKAKAAKEEKDFIDKFDDILKNANSPLERIGVSLSPVLQSISGFLNSLGNMFMGPVNGIMKVLDMSFAKLQDNLDSLASDLRGGEKTIPQAIGRFFAEIAKAIATLFDPTIVGDEAGTAIDTFFSEFAKGFAEIDGQKYVDMVIKGLQDMAMRLVFKEGDMSKGTTPLGEGLGKIFLLLAAPAFINALLIGVLPLAIQGMGSMLFSVLTGAGPKIAKASKLKKAADLATAAHAANAARTATIGSMALGAAPAAAAAAPAGGAAALGGLGAVPIVGWIVALTAAFVLLEKPLMGFAGMLKNFGVKMTESENLLTSSLGYVLKGLGQLLSGLTMFFNGLWEVVSNLLSGEPDKVRAGIAKLMQGVVQIFLGIGNTIGGLGGVIVTAIRNLFTTLAALITGSKPGAGPTVSTVTKNKKTGQVNANLNQNQVVAPGRAEAKGSPGKYFSSLEGAIGYENKHKPPGSDLVIANSSETIIPAFKGLNVDGNLAKANYEKTHSSETMVPNFEGLNVDGNLAKAINFEMANKPPSSDLVVANSSETIIPAANGLNAGMNMDGVISAIFSAASNTASTMATGFMSLNNTLKANQARNEQVIRSSAANTQAAIRQSTIMSMQGDRQILAAIKTASAAGGMFGGAMGTGKGSLGSAEAMARSMGLETTSGYRRGDPGYHGANRARDFSNGTGPTPQMMAYAQKMVGAYGTSLTELIYTPLGYSIKNGKKVAPYAQAAHYNHVHVAFGRGMGNPTMFSNANAAVAYESMMAPAGATISSVTANSSEFGGEKGTMNLTQNISVSGALDPKATAEAVWAYTTQAVDRLRYNNYG